RRPYLWPFALRRLFLQPQCRHYRQMVRCIGFVYYAVVYYLKLIGWPVKNIVDDPCRFIHGNCSRATHTHTGALESPFDDIDGVGSRNGVEVAADDDRIVGMAQF